MARHELLEALANAEELPVVAIGGCLLALDEVVPELLAVVESAAAGTLARPDDDNLLFFALHILGGGRVERLHEPLMWLLHRPVEDLDELLGDAKHETLGKIVAGGFNGNANDLFDLLCDPTTDEYVRSSVFGAAAFLTWAGRIDASATREFLQRFDEEEPIPAEDYSWFAWSLAIERLGWSDMAERVEHAYRDGRILNDLSTPAWFHKGLTEAIQAAPDDDSRFQKDCQGYIKDVAMALEGYEFQRSIGDAEPLAKYEPPKPLAMPKSDPWRHVGRNDPCPCGSGKKYKRCCLAA